LIVSNRQAGKHSGGQKNRHTVKHSLGQKD